MAERWANFAKTGDPNYEGGIKWNPWKFSQAEKEDPVVYTQENGWGYEDEYDDYVYDSGDEFETTDFDEYSDYYHLDRYEQAKYRKEALDLMRVTIAADNTEQRTEFVRMQTQKAADSNYWDRLFHHHDDVNAFNYEYYIDILMRAQKTGVVGNNIKELLDFHWQPEARLIEEDCTCAMWDQIRYRY